MHDGANEPAVVLVPAHEPTSPAAGRRDALLLGLGAGVGLALGIVLMLGVSATFTVLTPPFLSPRESLRVFNELNELRQQLNEFNEQMKLKDMEKDATLRQALRTVEATARTPQSGAPVAVPMAKKPGGEVDGSRVERPNDPFAEIDAEVKRLEQTQKVLNTMLDMLTSKHKERPKDR
jgi:hypothetical protein